MKEFELYVNQIVDETDLSDVEKGELFLELHDHLISLYEEHREKGLSEKETIALAIQSFGKPALLGNELQKSIFPFDMYLQRAAWLLFVPYTFILVFLLLIRRSSNLLFEIQFMLESGNIHTLFSMFNIIPFKTITMYITNFDHYNLDTWMMNVVGNVVLFIPLGLLVPILFRSTRNLKAATLLFIRLITYIELLQLITLAGVFDIDDIILNVTGALLGYGFWKVFRRFRIAKQTKNPIHT